MKNLANYISISRIIISIFLLIPETFSIYFYIMYVYCGISDIIFIFVAMIKILLKLSLTNVVIIWIAIIIIIKIINVISSYVYYKRIILLHTIANKITGFILFITPFIIVNIDSIVFEIVICSIATFAAVQEGHYIRIKKIYGEII